MFLASCSTDDENDGGTKSPGSDRFGEQVDLSSKDRNLVIGTYFLDSWTSEEPKDWNGDGTASTDLLTEFDSCYHDNPLFIGVGVYNRRDMGELCQGTESEGQVLVQGDWYLGYDATTDFAQISLHNGVGEVPDNLQQMELFEDSGRKTIVAKVWDQEYESLDVVVYRTCCD